MSTEIQQDNIPGTLAEASIDPASEPVEPVEINLDAVAAAVTAPRPSKIDSVLTMAARVLSLVFSPMLIPTYAMILAFKLTVLQYVQPSAQWVTVLVTFALTGVVPMVVIFMLYTFKIVTSTSLERRKERIIPYSAAFLGYCGCAAYLYSVNAPDWMWLFMAGGAAALLVVDVVNLWWKISAHAAAMGGFVGLCFFLIKYGQAMVDITRLTMAVVIIAGLVCTSRLILRRHTLWQIAAGVAVGVVAVLFFTTLSCAEPLAPNP